jgi:hypothetical protein
VLLSHLSAWETPENVVATVKEWIREFSRLSVMRSEMIVSFDEKTSRQIGSYAPLQSLIEPVEAHKVFTIRRGREKEVRDILEAMGYDPRVPELENVPVPAVEQLIFKDTWEEFTVVHDFENQVHSPARTVSSGKYSEELKTRELNELYHVIDYALLMGHAVKFEYEGSPYIKQDIYAIIPKKIVNGTEPIVEGTVEKAGAVKKFYMKRIKRIGVLSK